MQIGFYCHALGRYSLPIFSSVLKSFFLVLKSLFILNFDIFTSGFLGIELRRNLVFSIFFMCIYSVVIALFKV